MELMTQLGFTDVNDFNLYMGFLGILSAYVIYQVLP